MRCEIKQLINDQIDDLKVHVPELVDDFSLVVRMIVGEVGGIGEESFDLVVCTPKWLERKLRQTGPLFGYHHLLVEYYDYDAIRVAIDRFVGNVEAENWQGIAAKLRLIGSWEFDEYSPAVQVSDG